MYTGWIRSFKTNRPLLAQEREDALPREALPDVEADQRMGLVRFNSTYIDWIDRRFLFRGSMNTFLVTAGCLVMVGMYFFGLVWHSILAFSNGDSDWSDLLTAIPCFAMVGVVYYICLRREYFAYRYWPIRFNRKTRMVHVFRHNGPGGVLTVPWDEVFFHIGRGTDKKFLRDIRGEVLDGDTVIDTFALGHVADDERPVREMWEFIRRYMDEGPEALASDPLDRYVGLSVTPTLKNCFLAMGTYYAAGLPRPFQVLVSPFVVLYTFMRWLVFRTCREPVFPPEVEATCKVDADDPNVWPIPASAGQFARDIPGLLEHAREKAKRQWDAEQATAQPATPQGRTRSRQP